MSTLMFGRVEAATSSQLFLCNSFVSTCGISLSFFFFNDTATTEIYTLSLHDALPIFLWSWARSELVRRVPHIESTGRPQPARARSETLRYRCRPYSPGHGPLGRRRPPRRTRPPRRRSPRPPPPSHSSSTPSTFYARLSI